MSKQSYVLASKISIANAEVNDLYLSVNSSFYLKYSRFTVKALNKNVFQKFLADMSKGFPQKVLAALVLKSCLRQEKMG
jgi:hypothetical protein